MSSPNEGTASKQQGLWPDRLGGLASTLYLIRVRPPFQLLAPQLLGQTAMDVAGMLMKPSSSEDSKYASSVRLYLPFGFQYWTDRGRSVKIRSMQVRETGSPLERFFEGPIREKDLPILRGHARRVSDTPSNLGRQKHVNRSERDQMEQEAQYNLSPR